jgi:DNA-binding Lrp family transcriptional regulator
VNGGSELPRLDELDRRIVAALQSNPRASWSQLGGVIKVAETTVMRRVQRLRDRGLLIVIGSPDPLRCGLGQPVFVHFQTVPGEAPQLAQQLAQRSDIRYVALLTGVHDVMCELIVPNHGYLNRVLMSELLKIGSVRSSTTAMVLKRFKTNDQWSRELLDPSAPLSPEPKHELMSADERVGKLDDMDSRLVAALRVDGRRSYTDLSHDLGLSETAIARRIAALTASNRLFFVAMVDPVALGFELEVMMHLRVELGSLESVATALAAAKEVRYVSATTGWSDLACDAIFHDSTELYEFVTHTVGGIKGIREVEVDVVLESLKREYRYPLFRTDQ